MSSRTYWLWGLCAAVVAALCIPGFYLIWRAPESGREAWDLFFDLRTLALLGKTLGLAALVTALAAAVALPLAWLTSSSDLPGRKLWTVLACLPLALPSFVSGYVLLAAFGDGGIWASRGWPAPSVYGLGGATLALTLTTYPYLFLSFRAALLQQDPSLLEAARSLGASPLRAFTRVTLPRLVNAFRSGGLLVAFYVLSDFGAVSLLQYDTFSRAIYVQLEGAFDRSLAALWSLGLMGLAIFVLALSSLGPRERPLARTGLGVSRQPTPIRLGRWLLPSLLLCVSVVALGVALPAGVILHWLLDATEAVELSELAEPIWSSVLASGLAAAAAVVAILPLALLSARAEGRAIRWLERGAYASYSLPPVVVALSLISFGVRVVPALYGTLAMLVFAYVVRFAPQALGAIKGAFLQLSPRLSEAASSLGRSPVSVARTVVFPLVRPGIFAGAALVFLTAMKELPATLLLAPIGFETLAIRVWAASSEGQFGAGALPALLLIVVSSFSVWWLLRQESARGAKEMG